jgi:hypothetical protein
MPDAGASRKRQISGWRIPDGLMTAGSGAERAPKAVFNRVAGRATTDLPRAGRKCDAASPRATSRIFARALVCAAISDCAVRLKNFAQWNSIYRPAMRIAGCAGAIMAAPFRRSFGAAFFPFWALDSCGWDAQGGQSRQTGGLRNNPRAGQAISKHLYGTITYDQYSITVACYLCNTHPKTVCRVPFRAVPLLRVHGASVIVMLRRRGASRGRPVLGGSLKSLAFMRECPKARSG